MNFSKLSMMAIPIAFILVLQLDRSAAVKKALVGKWRIVNVDLSEVVKKGKGMQLLPSILPLMVELNLAESFGGKGRFEFRNNDSLSVYGLWANGEKVNINKKNIAYLIKDGSLYVERIFIPHKLEADNYYLTIKFPDGAKIKFQRDDF